jgi:KipI family sensor histidine kinase inhibitor
MIQALPSSLKDWHISACSVVGEANLLLRFSGVNLDEQNQYVVRFFDSLPMPWPDWVTDIVPSFDSVMISVDPLMADHYQALNWIAQQSPKTTSRRCQAHKIAVNYDATDDYDLTHIAEVTGLTVQKVVDLHTSLSLHVYAVGFAPGFAYLGELPSSLCIPRRNSPRVAVPAGAVALADSYSAIYPAKSPGGWHLIGQIAQDIAFHEHPFAVGDTVQFTCQRIIEA